MKLSFRKQAETILHCNNALEIIVKVNEPFQNTILSQRRLSQN